MHLKLSYVSPEASPPASHKMNLSIATGNFPSLQLLLLVVACIIGFTSAYLLFFCIKRCYYSRKSVKKYSMRGLELRHFGLGEIEKATSSFSEDYLVGSGAFGNVYKGVFDEDEILAVKRSHADSYESMQEFRNEVLLLSRVEHPNLVGLIGYCQEADQKILVYEYVPHGSLLEYIAGRRKSLTWKQRVHIAIGAAKGIAHLHEGVNPSIIHRDIKPSNILIGEGFEAKVSDFGLVKTGPVGDESHVSSQIKGTPGYLDPAYCSTFHLSTLTDVYSFGVILLQLIVARPPVDNSRPNAQYHIIDWARPSLENGIVEEIIDANLLLEACNMEIMLKMGQLALRCVERTPKLRPTMSEVVRELVGAVNYKKPQTLLVARKAVTLEESESFSVDGVKLQMFNIETDDVSIDNVTMGCFDVTGCCINVNKKVELLEITEDHTDDSSGYYVDPFMRKNSK